MHQNDCEALSLSFENNSQTCEGIPRDSLARSRCAKYMSMGRPLREYEYNYDHKPKEMTQLTISPHEYERDDHNLTEKNKDVPMRVSPHNMCISGCRQFVCCAA